MFKLGILFLTTLCYLSSGALSRAADPDFRSIKADLKVPPLVEENIGPGIRTKLDALSIKVRFMFFICQKIGNHIKNFLLLWSIRAMGHTMIAMEILVPV